MRRVAGKRGSRATDAETFLRLSAFLTGFDAIELQGTGLVDDHFAALGKLVDKGMLADLWAAARLALAHATDDARYAAMRSGIWKSNKLCPVAQNLVRLWYTGKWGAMPAQWQETWHPGIWEPAPSGNPLSPQAYIESLIWPAIGAHPPGAKPPGYGSWAEPPVSLPEPVAKQARARRRGAR